MQEIQELVRRELTHAMVSAAHAEKISVHAEGIAFASSPQLSVVNAPVAGIEQLDVKSMLDGCSALEDRSVMCWYLSGELVKERGCPLGEGFYTVVAQPQRGIVQLRDVKGQTAVEGRLSVCVGPEGSPPSTTAKAKISGGIDSASGSLWPPHIKVCGHVKIKQNGVTVTVEACIEAGF